MARTLDGEQTYYKCTECGAEVSAGEIQYHELQHFPKQDQSDMWPEKTKQ